MNFVAGMLLLVSGIGQEEVAYRSLTIIVEKIVVDYFSPDLVGSYCDEKVIEEFLVELMPDLARMMLVEGMLGGFPLLFYQVSFLGL